MKKGFIALAGLLLLTACNKNGENRIYYEIWGSQENGKTLIGPKGITMNVLSGSQIIGNIPEGLTRTRMWAGFYVENDLMFEDWPAFEPLNIELLGYGQTRTEPYARLGDAEADDPILFPTVDRSGRSLLELTPSIAVGMNYLDMWIACRPYMKNITEYAEVTPMLEIDPQIVPGVEQDTINMRLKFDSNRGDNNFEDAQSAASLLVAFDLKDAATDFGFNTLDEQGKPKTYIIKLTYKSFVNIDPPKEDELTMRFVTTTWTPADPYGKEAQEE